MVYHNLPERLEVYGEGGSVTIEESKRVKLWEFKSPFALGELPPDEETRRYPTGHYDELRHTFDAILDDGKVPVDGRDGRKSLEIVRAVYYSSFTGEQVSLPFTPEQDSEVDRLVAQSLS
jgi:predicted dehydrogenase